MGQVDDQTEQLADAAAARGDYAKAQLLLEQLANSVPTSAIWMKLAALRRRAGNPKGALAAIDALLADDPLDATALLARGSLLEVLGRSAEAADVYDAALSGFGTNDPVAGSVLAASIVHARTVRDAHRGQLERDMTTTIGDDLSPGERRRLNRFVSNASRRTKPSSQAATHFSFPGLAVDEFHDRARFPWLASVEAASDTIANELSSIVANSALTEPYIRYGAGKPLGPWRDLNNSHRWSTINLFKAGRPTAAAALCSATMASLATVPQPSLPDRSPAAMFSRLAPRTRIPPHTGVGNMRLVCHLPLIVPPGCGFRVGGETREWVPGVAWVFDDTIEHEAWNDSDEERIILIFDVWHPDLSLAERSAITAMMGALDASYGDTGI